MFWACAGLIEADSAWEGCPAFATTPAAEPLASMFRSANTYPGLVDEMIGTDAELEDAAIPILDRLYSRDLAAAIARYEQLKPRLATTDVSYAAHAPTAGAIDQLLVDLDAVVPGLVSDVDGALPMRPPTMPRLTASSMKSRGVRFSPGPG